MRDRRDELARFHQRAEQLEIRRENNVARIVGLHQRAGIPSGGWPRTEWRFCTAWPRASCPPAASGE